VSHDLTDVHRALCRDGTHVVLVVDAPVPADFAARVAEEVRGETRVEVTPLAGLDAAAAGRRLLVALGLDPGEAQPEIRARIELELLAKAHTSLALIVPDAPAVEPDALRRLGELAQAAPGRALRVALVAGLGPEDPDPTARLVAALGTGVAKIELGERRRSLPEPLSEPAAAGPTLPPLVAAGDRPRRVRPIPVRNAASARRRRRRAGISLGGLLLLALPAAILTRESAPPVPGPVAAAVAPRAATPTRPAAVAETPAGVPRPAPSPVPTPRPEGVREAEEVRVAPAKPRFETAPAPAPESPSPPPVSVRVNFNASPWAEIEVDGRAVGPTPIADLSLAAGIRHVRATFPDGRVVERDLRVGALANRFRIE